MIIDNDKKYVFVRNAKTGTTSISRQISKPEDPLPHIYHMQLKNILLNYPHTKDYFKFMFVRNPYQRFLSCWYNFTDLKAGHNEWNGDLLKYKSIEDFVFNFEQSKWCTWPHFVTQFSMCEVENKIGVDFIGKYEQFQHDYNQICDILKLNKINLPKYRSSNRSEETNNLSVECKNVLYKFYEIDFITFGYEK